MARPRYDDLPPAPLGGRSGWGAVDPEIGALGLIEPEEVAAAAGLVRKGRVFSLNYPLDTFDPPLAMGRGIARHRVLHAPGTIGFDDVLDNFYPQASSQWDALGHVGYSPEEFFGGATEEDVVTGRRATIERWAERGIAGRAVLVDLLRFRSEAGRPYDPGSSEAFGVEDLEGALAMPSVQPRSGDILLLHTGFAAWYGGLPAADRARLPRRLTAPGIDHSEDVARWLWDAGIAAVASDTFAVEVWPPDFAGGSPFGFLHRILIGQMGLALGELWRLEELAEDCAGDGVYEMLLVSAPLHVRGGIGSPPNALALK